MGIYGRRQTLTSPTLEGFTIDIDDNLGAYIDLLPKHTVRARHAVLSSFTGLTSALITFSNESGIRGMILGGCPCGRLGWSSGMVASVQDALLRIVIRCRSVAGFCSVPCFIKGGHGGTNPVCVIVDSVQIVQSFGFLIWYV